MRDYQKSTVYKWERQNIKSGAFIGFKNIQDYVNETWDKMGLKYPPIVKPLPNQVRKIGGDATRTVVRFPDTGTFEATILHELAHSMTATIDGPSHQHNEYFVGMVMVLYEKFLGVDPFFMWYTAQKDGIKFEKFMKPIMQREGN